MIRRLSMALALLLALGARAGAQSELPQASLGDAGPLDPWMWVVPAVEPSGAWVLAGFFSGQGTVRLDLALVDAEGRVVAGDRWELVAGRPADYDLHDLTRQGPQEPVALLLSGLEARPDRLALSLRHRGPDGSPAELAGTWLRSDPSWLPNRENAP